MSITVTDLFAGRGEIVIDLSKIVAAIMKAFENIKPAIDEAVQNITTAMTAFADTLGEYTSQYVDAFSYSADTMVHSLLHFLMHCFWTAKEFVVEVITGRHHSRDAVYYAAAICISVKSLTIRYREHLWVSRKINLFRRQDRGSTDSASYNDNYFEISVLS